MYYIHVYSNPDYRNECIEDCRILFYIPGYGWFGSYVKDNGKTGIIMMSGEDTTENEIVSFGNAKVLRGLEDLIYHWILLPEQQRLKLISCCSMLEDAAEKFIKKANSTNDSFGYEVRKAIKEYKETIVACIQKVKLPFDVNKSVIYKGVRL